MDSALAAVVVAVAVLTLSSCDQKRSGAMSAGSVQRLRDADGSWGAWMKLLKSRRLLLLTPVDGGS